MPLQQNACLKKQTKETMKPLDLNFICQTLGLPMPSENQPVSRIVTDSRDIQDGDVFFALAGERFDAHDFVEDVLAAGATAVVVRAKIVRF